MFDDVRQVTADALRRRLGSLPEVVVGSPPCQDLSAANHRARGLDGERSGLFLEAIRIVGEVRPVWCAFENSPRLRAKGADRLCSDLEALGYSCEPLVVGADNLLAPHIRKRCWLVAADADRVQLRQQSGWSGRQDWQGAPESRAAAADHPHADSEGQSGLPGHVEMAGVVDVPAVGGDTDREGLAIGEGERADACPKLAALERAVGPLGIRWHRGPARHLGMADGVSRGLARASIAAYGDAVLPQIPEAIGRVMGRLTATRDDAA
jgi:DNA (cytosine-5)-methyltransferase 1